MGSEGVGDRLEKEAMERLRERKREGGGKRTGAAEKLSLSEKSIALPGETRRPSRRQRWRRGGRGMRKRVNKKRSGGEREEGGM